LGKPVIVCFGSIALNGVGATIGLAKSTRTTNFQVMSQSPERPLERLAIFLKIQTNFRRLGDWVQLWCSSLFLDLETGAAFVLGMINAGAESTFV